MLRSDTKHHNPRCGWSGTFDFNSHSLIRTRQAFVDLQGRRDHVHVSLGIILGPIFEEESGKSMPLPEITEVPSEQVQDSYVSHSL